MTADDVVPLARRMAVAVFPDPHLFDNLMVTLGYRADTQSPFLRCRGSRWARTAHRRLLPIE